MPAPRDPTGEVLNLRIPCAICRVTITVPVNRCDYEAFQNGTPVLKAMPYLTNNEKSLITAGKCSKCFPKR